MSNGWFSSMGNMSSHDISHGYWLRVSVARVREGKFPCTFLGNNTKSLEFPSYPMQRGTEYKQILAENGHYLSTPQLHKKMKNTHWLKMRNSCSTQDWKVRLESLIGKKK